MPTDVLLGGGVGHVTVPSIADAALSNTAPQSVATTNTPGASTAVARDDHAHALTFPVVQAVLGGATGPVSVNGQALTNVQTPGTPTDAANKSYVDAVAAGLNLKASCVVVSTTPIVLSGTQTIDGVLVNVGDRVLVAGQGGNITTPAVANGIYVVAAGAWARSADMQPGTSAQGTFTFVAQGTANADTGWVCVTNAPNAVVGANAIQFSIFSAAPTSTFRQSLFTEIVVDTTTTSTVFVDLLTQNITLGAGGILIVNFYASSANSQNNATNAFRLVIDGTPSRAIAIDAPAGSDYETGALFRRITGLAPGAHTIKIQWKVSAGTANISPQSQPDFSSAGMLLEEVTV